MFAALIYDGLMDEVTHLVTLESIGKGADLAVVNEQITP